MKKTIASLLLIAALASTPTQESNAQSVAQKLEYLEREAGREARRKKVKLDWGAFWRSFWGPYDSNVSWHIQPSDKQLVEMRVERSVSGGLKDQ